MPDVGWDLQLACCESRWGARVCVCVCVWVGVVGVLGQRQTVAVNAQQTEFSGDISQAGCPKLCMRTEESNCRSRQEN